MNTKEIQQENTMICEKHNEEMVKVENFFYNMHKRINGVIDPSIPEFDFECQSCKKEESEIEQKKEEERIKKHKLEQSITGIPKIYHNSKLSDFSGLESLHEWIKSKTGFLYIHGTTGTGKTHLLCAIKKRCNEIGWYCSLFFSSDVFLSIRESFNGGSETEADIIRSCTQEHLCMFDDFGAQKCSEFAIETWYNIINNRYINGYPTIFTSNVLIKEIAQSMNDRIASRLASGMVFELKGTDRRLENRKKQVTKLT